MSLADEPEQAFGFTKQNDTASARSQDDQVRVSVRLSPEAKAALDEIMRLGRMRNIQEAIRRAIGDELFLQQQIEGGWKVVIQKDNKYREVVWPRI